MPTFVVPDARVNDVDRIRITPLGLGCVPEGGLVIDAFIRIVFYSKTGVIKRPEGGGAKPRAHPFIRQG